MNWVDLAVLGLLLVVAAMGWRAGLIATALGFAGFLAGALAATWVVPQVLAQYSLPDLVNVLAVLAGIVLLGLLGQSLAGWLGGVVRDSIGLRPIRWMDSLGGLAVSAAAFLTAAWLLLSVVVTLPQSGPVGQVRDSRSYAALEQVMTGPAGGLLDQVRGLLATLDLPRLPFNESILPPVAEPGDLSIPDQVRDVAGTSVLQVIAESADCSRTSTGSAVMASPERVVTNAHVVAGSDRVVVRRAGRGPGLPAVVVALDRGVDVAVLHVPGLAASIPSWVGSAPRGTEGVVAGYPLGGPLRLRPARVRGIAEVPMDTSSTLREVYVFRGRVQPGNSGGPLLDMQGRVIGLVFANAQDDENTGFALTSNQVGRFIRDSRQSTQAVPTGSCET